jgi:hypothetical protein
LGVLAVHQQVDVRHWQCGDWEHPVRQVIDQSLIERSLQNLVHDGYQASHVQEEQVFRDDKQPMLLRIPK